MALQTWQIVTILVIAFLFGFGIGRTFGEARARKKMDKREENHSSSQSSDELALPISPYTGEPYDPAWGYKQRWG